MVPIMEQLVDNELDCDSSELIAEFDPDADPDIEIDDHLEQDDF
jgi:hypothetical protein